MADPSVSVVTSKDGNGLSAGGGTVTNLGNGQYDYSIPQGETNGANCSWQFSSAGDVPVNISIFTVTP